MYFPKFFELYEFVPRSFYPKDLVLGEKIKVWWLLDDRILRAAYLLRERYGKLVCNDWHWRPHTWGNQYRGWRPSDCSVGAVMSQHKWGRALDLIPLECTVEEIRADLIAMSNAVPFSYITSIEMNVGWLHIDCRNLSNSPLHLIYP